MSNVSVAVVNKRGFEQTPTLFWVLSAACLAAFIWLNAPTLLTLHSQWLNSYYSHGYPVAVLAAFLLAREVARGSLLPLRLNVVGVAAFLGAVLATYLGRVAGIVIVPQVMLPIVILSAVWAVSGLRAVRAFWPSAFFLYFAIPLWEDLEAAGVPLLPLNDWLLALTTSTVSGVVRVTGIPAFIENNLISIPAGVFEIAEGCSGRVYFIAGVELALFYGLLYLRQWRSRLFLVAAAAALSLVGNWLRIYALILIGHFSAMQNPLVEDHSDFGWVVFLLVVAPMVLLGRRLEDAEAESPPPAPTGLIDRHAVGVQTATLTMLVGLSLAGYFLEPRATPVAAIAPPVVDGWQQTSSWLGPGRPLFRGAGAEIAVAYAGVSAPQQRVDVYLASYSAQLQGSEVVHGDNRPEGSGAEVVQRRTVTIEDVNGASLTFAEMEVGATGLRRLVWYAARVAGRETADPVVAKVYQVLGALRGRQDAQVVVLSARCEASCDTSRTILTAYANQATNALFGAAAHAANRARESR